MQANLVLDISPSTDSKLATWWHSSRMCVTTTTGLYKDRWHSRPMTLVKGRLTLMVCVFAIICKPCSEVVRSSAASLGRAPSH